MSARAFSWMAGLVVVGWGARAWLDGPVAAFHPVGAYRVRMLGLGDIFASPWMALFGAFLAVVSLIRAARARAGRRWVAMAAELSLLLVPVGIALTAGLGMQARAVIDESGQVDYVELVRGEVRAWKPLSINGKAIEGFRLPGFAIQAGEKGVFHFYRDGLLAETQSISSRRPGRFDGMTFHLESTSRAAGLWADVTVRSARDGVEREFRGLTAGKAVNLEGFGFSVVEIEPKTDESDPSALIEYREAGKNPERFWILQKFKDHDAIKRKRSAQHFALEDVRPRFTAHLALSRDPGRYWVWLGLAFFSLFGMVDAVIGLRAGRLSGRWQALLSLVWPILTAHLAMVSVWAYDSHGVYWSWDPRWLLSLMAWLLTAAAARAGEKEG